MSNGGFFGGFAQGFSSTYGARKKKSLSDELGIRRLDLDERKFEYQQETTNERLGVARDQLELQRSQAESLNEHREWNRQLQEKQHALELQSADLQVAESLVKLLDGKYSPGARKAALQMFASTLGVDPKNPQFKNAVDLISNLSAEEAQAFQDYIGQVAPDAQPGTVKAIVAKFFSDPAVAMDMLKQITGGGDLQLKSVMTPEGPRFVLEKDAIGMEPGPSGQYETPEEQLKKKAGEMILARDDKKVQMIDEKAEKAIDLQEDLDAFRAAIRSETFTSGPFAGARYSFGKLVQFLGLEGVVDLEKFASGGTEAAEIMTTSSANIVARLADQLGRTTNMQLSFLQETVPGLMKSPEGNEIIIDLFERSVKRDILAQNLVEEYIQNYNSLRPEGRPTVWEEIRRMELANPVVDESMIERMKTTSEKNKGIDILELFSTAEKAATGTGPMPEPDEPGFGETNQGKPPPGSRLTLGNGDEYKVTGFKKIGDVSYRFIEVESSLGGTDEYPVVWDEQSRNNLPEDTKYVNGRTGQIFRRRNKKPTTETEAE